MNNSILSIENTLKWNAMETRNQSDNLFALGLPELLERLKVEFPSGHQPL